MGLWIDSLTVDAEDPDKLADFWCEALGYEVTFRSEEGEPDREVTIESPDRSRWCMLMVEVHDERKVKNRLHLDLRPDDQEAEVARLEELGAKRVDIGQGPEVTWVVMADPEGNEFCILRARPPGEES
jgi:catechol 2,3-dioxygenase-like lactoylglutathione lyase family enzyme